MENYQKMTDEIIEKLNGTRPRLLLHACCAPCSSYVLEYLSGFFEITVYFYNPNIASYEEYAHRENELMRFVNEFDLPSDVEVVAERYEHSEFTSLVKGKEDMKEGGARCFDCYRLRLEQTAKYAKEHNFDIFSTTLSISPHKNAQWLNDIGKSMAEKYGTDYLFSDFKKRNGYKRSCELSREYDLYRQSFCGCEFSKRDALKEEIGVD